jgi:hypothetical protein
LPDSIDKLVGVVVAAVIAGSVGLGEDATCCVWDASSISLTTGEATVAQPTIDNMQAVHKRSQFDRFFLIIFSTLIIDSIFPNVTWEFIRFAITIRESFRA